MTHLGILRIQVQTGRLLTFSLRLGQSRRNFKSSASHCVVQAPGSLGSPPQAQATESSKLSSSPSQSSGSAVRNEAVSAAHATARQAAPLSKSQEPLVATIPPIPLQSAVSQSPSIVSSSPFVTDILSDLSPQLELSPELDDVKKAQDKDCYEGVRNQIDPTTVHRVFYFDSLSFAKKLEAKGFSREQAEGCVECLLEVVGNTLEHQAKHMVTKSEQKIETQQLHSEIKSVKQDLVLLQKSEFSALRTDTERIRNNLARNNTHFQDEMVKLKGQFTLDINLERGRAIEAHAANEKKLQVLDNKIVTEIAHLKTKYEIYRNDIFKYAAGTVLTCTTMILGFIRLWK